MEHFSLKYKIYCCYFFKEELKQRHAIIMTVHDMYLWKKITLCSSFYQEKLILFFMYVKPLRIIVSTW